ncbi:MAG: sn-glycerol-3-phosphate ABC transporter ATP-binding protein UgpC [bacterium]|nr:sn-glycerol-3-phosphate ABC transporter ATP-binding protein UgpC [bacterium]
MSTIEIKAVAKRFGDTPILHGADLSIHSGEFMVFVGPSGCGKTTLLRLIAGLEEVSSGQIEIGGKDVTHLEPKNRGVAMVFQNYALYPHMTVRGNLEYPLKILKLGKAQRNAKIEEVARMLEIEPLLGRKPGQLSGGQRQRVAIGRALVREPLVFLFDEPLSNLDARLREQMRQEIGKLHRRLGRTSLYVTHDQAEAMTLADRLAVMNAGDVLQVGPPLELYQNPNCLFVAQFLGHPPLGVLRGKAEGTSFSGDWGSFTLSPERSGLLTLGIRPEKLSLKAPAKPHIELQGQVTFFEHLGREVHAELELAPGERLWMVLEEQNLTVGQALTVYAAETDLLFFDTASGKRV